MENIYDKMKTIRVENLYSESDSENWTDNFDARQSYVYDYEVLDDIEVGVKYRIFNVVTGLTWTGEFVEKIGREWQVFLY